MEPVSRWKRGAFTAAPGELAEDAPADVVEGGVALLFGGQQSLHQLAALGRVVAPEAWRHPTRKNPPRKKKTLRNERNEEEPLGAIPLRWP